MAINYLANLAYFVPELILVLTMAGVLFIESAYKSSEKGRGFVFSSATLGLVLALFSLVTSFGDKPVSLFTDSIVFDSFGVFVKVIMVLGTLGTLFLSYFSKDIYSDLKTEFISMSIGVLIGGMLLVSSTNMLTTYLGIETLSILSYVLASLKKNDELSSEAGLKYALYGGVTAGVMLFGISHIYGVTGSINFSEIGLSLSQLSSTEMLIVVPSFLLFFVGLGFKIACAPFHMWSPDVYEGAPIPVTAFFSIVPKLAGLAIILRASLMMFGGTDAVSVSWIGLIQVIAVMTMIVGNVSAIGQQSVKRMLAYSSIAHGGMMLLAVVVMDEVAMRAILFYGVTYLFMTLVVFYVTSFISDEYGNDHFDRFNGLIKRYPTVAILMGVSLFSLAGLPPFSGFIAKFNIFAIVLEKGFYTLAVIAALNSVVSLYYYMKIVRLMVFKDVDSSGEISGFNFLNQSMIVILSVPVVFLGLFWNKLIAFAGGALLFVE